MRHSASGVRSSQQGSTRGAAQRWQPLTPPKRLWSPPYLSPSAAAAAGVATPAAGAASQPQRRCATRQRLSLTPPRRLLSQPASPSPTAPAAHLDLAIMGLSVAPPGFHNIHSLVQPPSYPPDRAAAARAAAILRLCRAAAARVLQQQLGLANVFFSVKRVWLTPGGRWAACIRLPVPLGAQALARKRHRLCGTPISVDLLRDQHELAAWKVGREQQLRQQGPVGEAPTACQAQVPAPARAALLSVSPCFLLPTFALVALGILLLIPSIMHFFPP